ncbi:MAG: hypothetical protein GXO74_02700 [Calditrichaeota bacterium]|nr:hypothetical protein [Calditrichota bacterium]
MKRFAILTMIFGVIILFQTSCIGQDIENFVSKYTSENGKKYLQPLADAFGANMNSGFFHSAHIERNGFQFYGGIVTMFAPIADDQKVFTAQTEGLFSPPTTAEAPTIFGNSENVAVEGTGGTAYVFPGGFDMTTFPIAVPQLSFGSIMGTEAMLRFIDIKLDDNLGKLSLVGFGVRHSVSQYFPTLPVDIAVGFYKQSFKLGNIIDANSLSIGAQASYSKGILTFYGGLANESSNLNISYAYESDENGEDISFELKAKNSFRLTTGVAAALGPIVLHTDFNFAQQNVVVVGLGIGL